MITLQSCIAMCDLDEAEVLAIAEHEAYPGDRSSRTRSIPAFTRSTGPRRSGTCCATTFVPRWRATIATTQRELFMALRHFLSPPRGLPRKLSPRYLKTPEALFGGLPFSATA